MMGSGLRECVPGEGCLRSAPRLAIGARDSSNQRRCTAPLSLPVGTPGAPSSLAMRSGGSSTCRPAGQASYPVPVRRVAALLHASFRPRLATTPLRFANPSPPSGWMEDLHLQAVGHARQEKGRPEGRPVYRDIQLVRSIRRLVGSRRMPPSRRWPGCGHRMRRRLREDSRKLQRL